MRKSFKLIGLGSAALALVATSNAHAAPILIYNPSPSVPVGLYWRDSGAPRIGDLVSVQSVNAAPVYVRARDFSDRTDKFIKRIAATSGQVVCAQDDHISIDGAQVVTRLAHDKMGRALPSWSGCRTLKADEVFLLGDTDDSFDGRYWGPVSLRAVDGPWRPVQPRRVKISRRVSPAMAASILNACLSIALTALAVRRALPIAAGAAIGWIALQTAHDPLAACAAGVAVFAVCSACLDTAALWHRTLVRLSVRAAECLAGAFVAVFFAWTIARAFGHATMVQPVLLLICAAL